MGEDKVSSKEERVLKEKVREKDYVNISLRIPKELHQKMNYIAKKTFFTKQQMFLMYAVEAIEEKFREVYGAEVEKQAQLRQLRGKELG